MLSPMKSCNMDLTICSSPLLIRGLFNSSLQGNRTGLLTYNPDNGQVGFVFPISMWTLGFWLPLVHTVNISHARIIVWSNQTVFARENETTQASGTIALPGSPGRLLRRGRPGHARAGDRPGSGPRCARDRRHAGSADHRRTEQPYFRPGLGFLVPRDRGADLRRPAQIRQGHQPGAPRRRVLRGTGRRQAAEVQAARGHLLDRRRAAHGGRCGVHLPADHRPRDAHGLCGQLQAGQGVPQDGQILLRGDLRSAVRQGAGLLGHGHPAQTRPGGRRPAEHQIQPSAPGGRAVHPQGVGRGQPAGP